MLRFAPLALLALAGAAGAVPPANPYNDALRRLSPLMQRSVLRRAILDDKNGCGRVVSAVWRGPYRNLQRWEAQCDRGGAYAIFVGTDQSVQVRDCPSLAALKLPPCAPLPKPDAAPAKALKPHA